MSKKIELLKSEIQSRIDKLESGESNAGKYTIKGQITAYKSILDYIDCMDVEIVNETEKKNDIFYVIAYKDINGNNFAGEYPWLFGDCSTLNEAKREMNRLIDEGNKNVIIFKMESDVESLIPWEYVYEHKIDL